MDSSFNDAAESDGSSVQYAMYRTVRPGASGAASVYVVTGSHVRRHTFVPPDETGPLSPIFFGASGAGTETSAMVTLIVPVRPPKLAVTVTGWFDVTAEAVRTPAALIVAFDVLTLHVGLIAAVVPLSHVPVAVYVAVPPSSNDDGPLTAMVVSAAGVSTITTVIVPVRPPKLAVTVTGWFDVTAEAVRAPAALIVAFDVLTLHVGLTTAVVPSFHVPVAVYVAVPHSFNDDGPITATLASVAVGGGGGGVTTGTTQEYAGESDDSSPVFRTAFAVK